MQERSVIKTYKSCIIFIGVPMCNKPTSSKAMKAMIEHGVKEWYNA